MKYIYLYTHATKYRKIQVENNKTRSKSYEIEKKDKYPIYFLPNHCISSSRFINFPFINFPLTSRIDNTRKSNKNDNFTIPSSLQLRKLPFKNSSFSSPPYSTLYIRRTQNRKSSSSFNSPSDISTI